MLLFWTLLWAQTAILRTRKTRPCCWRFRILLEPRQVCSLWPTWTIFMKQRNILSCRWQPHHIPRPSCILGFANWNCRALIRLPSGWGNWLEIRWQAKNRLSSCRVTLTTVFALTNKESTNKRFTTSSRIGRELAKDSSIWFTAYLCFEGTDSSKGRSQNFSRRIPINSTLVTLRSFWKYVAPTVTSWSSTKQLSIPRKSWSFCSANLWTTLPSLSWQKLWSVAWNFLPFVRKF